MKLIALRDFACVGDLQDVKIEGKAHEKHVHKGATFDIGKAEALKDLSKRDQQLVAQLTVTGCVGDATDPKVVAAVKESIAADKKSEENLRKLSAKAEK